jgi:DNA-binding XRE family transcriptional regulator
LTHNPETGLPEKEQLLPVKEIIGDEAARTSSKDWQAEQIEDPENVPVLNALQLGDQIARLGNRRGLTQAQLAEKVGVQEATIVRLERGNRIPSLSLLRRIAAALEAQVEPRFLWDDAKRTKK